MKCRGQKVEDRKQKAESRRQKAEGRKQKAEGRRQKAVSDGRGAEKKEVQLYTFSAGTRKLKRS